MAGLQRSAVSFRRQGSSGFVWDDRFLSEELNKVKQEQQHTNTNTNNNINREAEIIDPTPTLERNRSNGGARGYRTGKVAPVVEPPSPRLSACGFCASFGKAGDTKGQRSNPGKHRPW